MLAVTTSQAVANSPMPRYQHCGQTQPPRQRFSSTTPMHMSQLCADPNRRRTNPLGQTACIGVTTALHSFRHQEPSSCPVPATGDFVCEAMAEFVARWLISLEQSAGPTNAGVRASRSQLSRLRVEKFCLERQQDMEIARCVESPRARENYVEVWLATKGHRPRLICA